ncbi:CRISPR-associated helicase Cas3' [Spirosoma panaciterrae]|uniref:CRISPR-associated helicase Cas3' n=1 Tax=Spirosoma panaciterrae TaxID=496058 RepID=UPI00035EA95F|nr:CRISPR-associated helicase Cas3' [Spirosoma panaciterrae]
MEPLAKPSGITLRDHRQHVYDEALALLDAHPFWEQKYRAVTGDDLRYRLRRVAWWHDAGKAHEKWSKACQCDYELYRSWRVKQGKPAEAADDAQNAVEFRQYEAAMRKDRKNSSPHLMATGLRHEFDSLLQAQKALKDEKALTLAEQVAIAAHHGKLGYRHEKRWREDGRAEKSVGPYWSIWQELTDSSKSIGSDGKRARNQDDWKIRVIERYRIAALRALLQLADTRASRRESGGTVPDIMLFSYDFPKEWKLRGVQTTVLEGADQPISILRAPTGSGKTDASLLWAKHQTDHDRADRLTIVMPTRFTSNALAISVDKNVSATGLYHSSAWYTRYGHVSNKDRDDARELHKLARSLATPVTVCTIDHLLLCLTGTKEDHHTSFFFLANSAVVFDEADFYDPFIQANLTVLLDTLRLLQVPVLIMSATVPDSLRNRYGINDTILDVPAEEQTTKRQIVWRGSAETSADVEDILNEMLRLGTGIVYANTVDRAYEYFQWFAEKHKEERGPEPILYHSRFTEPDKKTIEERLIAALGKDAWLEKKNAVGIAILTQIGEMSVNISAPIMLSDACPWDRLAQRAGRLDRFGLEPDGGILYVVEPYKEGISYPAPYGELPKGGNVWIPADAFTQTVQELSSDFGKMPALVTPANFVERVNRLYPKNLDFTSKAEQNRDRLKSLMRLNWMIVSPLSTDEDNGKVSAEWKSRDIPPQQPVFIKLPDADVVLDGNDESLYVFKNWDAYRGYELEFGVSCPDYLIRMGNERKQLMLFRFRIGDDKEQHSIWITEPSIYSPEIGLALLGKGEKTDRAKGVFG